MVPVPGLDSKSQFAGKQETDQTDLVSLLHGYVYALSKLTNPVKM